MAINDVPIRTPISANDRVAVRVLLSGGIIACPTEGVWGLSCRATDKIAIKRLLELKKRSSEKGLIILVSSLQQVKEWIGPIPCYAREHLHSEGHRPITWLLPSTSKCPPILNGGRHSVAIRIVNLFNLIHFCKKVGPIVSTSANHSGCQPLLLRHQVVARFGKTIDWICAGRTGGLKGPTRIEDPINRRIIRPGYS